MRSHPLKGETNETTHAETPQLQRIVINLRASEMILRVLYKSEGDTNPGTVRRRREVEDLVRSGLERALEALEGGAECVGTSGFTVREDILCTAAGDLAAPEKHKKERRTA